MKGGGGCEPIMIPNTAYSTYLFIFIVVKSFLMIVIAKKRGYFRLRSEEKTEILRIGGPDGNKKESRITMGFNV